MAFNRKKFEEAKKRAGESAPEFSERPSDVPDSPEQMPALLSNISKGLGALSPFSDITGNLPGVEEATTGFEEGFGLSPETEGGGFARGAGRIVGETGLAAAGAGIGAVQGAALGTSLGGPVGGVLGGILGAGMGGVTGEGATSLIRDSIAFMESTLNGDSARLKSTKTLEQDMDRIKEVGVMEAVFEGALRTGGPLLGAMRSTKVAKLAGEGLAEAGGGLMRIVNNTDQRLAKAAFKDMEKFVFAPTQKAVGDAYRSFYDTIKKETGIKVMGRKEFLQGLKDPFETVTRSFNDMKAAHAKLVTGEKLSLQEAVSASQAARKIRDQKRRGNEFAQEISEQSDELKDLFDDYIDKTVPKNLKGKWKEVREMAFWRNVQDEFMSLLPQNQNSSSNILRSVTGAGVGASQFGAAGVAGSMALQAPVTGGALLGAGGLAQRAVKGGRGVAAGRLLAPGQAPEEDLLDPNR